MNTYSLTSTNFIGEVLFKYNLNGDLIYYENNTQMTDEQLEYLLIHLPLTYDMLRLLTQKSKTIKMQEIPEDLSFERFHAKYNYKMGSKKRAESLWKGLSNTDRYLCLQSIDRYNNYLNKKKTIEKAYPETFLHQRRWENNFNI